MPRAMMGPLGTGKLFLVSELLSAWCGVYSHSPHLHVDKVDATMQNGAVHLRRDEPLVATSLPIDQSSSGEHLLRASHPRTPVSTSRQAHVSSTHAGSMTEQRRTLHRKQLPNLDTVTNTARDVADTFHNAEDRMRTWYEGGIHDGDGAPSVIGWAGGPHLVNGDFEAQYTPPDYCSEIMDNVTGWRTRRGHGSVMLVERNCNTLGEHLLPFNNSRRFIALAGRDSSIEQTFTGLTVGDEYWLLFNAAGMRFFGSEQGLLATVWEQNQFGTPIIKDSLSFLPDARGFVIADMNWNATSPNATVKFLNESPENDTSVIFIDSVAVKTVDPGLPGFPHINLTFPSTVTFTTTVEMVHCMWGEWGDWGSCGRSCGPDGLQTRVRNKSKVAQGGGRQCLGPASEVVECNRWWCPADCKWTEWEEWEKCNGCECTISCGGEGRMKRNRTVGSFERYGGASCKGEALETGKCGQIFCPLDCVWEDWSSFTECTHSCGPHGTKHRKRDVQQTAAHGGRICPGHSLDLHECNQHISCPIDCDWDEWSEFSECSYSCGGGNKIRTRFMNPAAQFGGVACTGLNSHTERCNWHPCPTDCKWDAWASYGECTLSCGMHEPNVGWKTRDRQVKVPADHGGPPCAGSKTERAPCNRVHCNGDCVWHEWGQFGECSATCGKNGTQTRTRGQTPEVYGGHACTGSAYHTARCNTQPCPVDCVWGSWGNWGECSHSCGMLGTRFRLRSFKVEAAYGGVPCAEQSSISMPCNRGVFCAVDCAWDDWTEYGPCSHSCGAQGVYIRTRVIKFATMYGGEQCAGEKSQSQGCNRRVSCPVDCVWNEWSIYSACDKTCGMNGTQTRWRSRKSQALSGGVDCPPPVSQTRSCNHWVPCSTGAVIPPR